MAGAAPGPHHTAARNDIARLHRATRAQALLVECNRALVRAESEQQLFEGMCRILTAQGGYAAAWIGVVMHDADRTIRPVAHSNTLGLDFTHARISWADNERGRGPAGKAVRSGSVHAAVVDGDADFGRWRREVAKPGASARVRAVAALPVRVENRVDVVLGLDSAEPGVFDADEIELLGALADDIGYGLAALRGRDARRRMQEALLEGERRYGAALDVALVGINSIARDGRIVSSNPFFDRLLGYEPGALIGRNMAEFRFPEDHAALAELHAQRADLWAGRIDRFTREARYRRKDGSAVWAEITVALLRDASGTPLYDLTAIADITSRKRAEAVLRESEQRYRNLTSLAADYYWELDTGHRVVHIESGMHGIDLGARVTGIVGNCHWEMGFTNLSDAQWQAHRECLDRRETFRDLVLRRIDGGAAVWLSLSGYPAFNADGSFAGYRGIARDVTGRVQAELLRTMEHEVSRALTEADTSGAAVRTAMKVMCETLDWVCGRYFRLDLDCGKLRLAEMWGRNEPDVLAYLERSRELVFGPGEGLSGRAWLTREPVWSTDKGGDSRLIRPDMSTSARMRAGFVFPVIDRNQVLGVISLSCQTIREPDTSLLGAARVIGQQIGQFLGRKAAEERNARLAQFDSLTGLPNRHLFQDRLAQSVALARRGGATMAMLFIDLDRFKLVNDTMGHAAGDRLLKEAAVRLSRSVRASDTVARLGGDEFAATLLDLSRPGDAAVVAQKIIDALAEPFMLDGHDAYVSGSVGIALFPGDSEDAAGLVMNADAAMYRAKERGRNNYQFYTRALNERAMQRLALESSLRKALDRQEFLLHYQPRLSLKTGRICGMEALLRWNHPERGVVAPAEFIPVLEETGLIVPVGEWVLRSACRQVRLWADEGLPVTSMAVNLSARQFQAPDLERSLMEILSGAGIDARVMELEITESLLIDDPDRAARTLRSLAACGLKISVDDFGTGYSSLAYLKRFPLDALKIDRSFVRDIARDADDAAITVAIIDLAHALGMEVVAEGVETRGQLDFLARHGCDEIQGFFFSPPIDAAQCARLLREGTQRKTP